MSRQPFRQVEREVIQRGLQFVAAATDVGQSIEQFDRSVHRHAVAGLVRLLAIITTLPGEDERLRFLAGVRKPAIDQQLIDPLLGGEISCLPMNNQVGQFSQPMRPVAKGCHGRAPGDALLGHFA